MSPLGSKVGRELPFSPYFSCYTMAETLITCPKCDQQLEPTKLLSHNRLFHQAVVKVGDVEIAKLHGIYTCPFDACGMKSSNPQSTHRHYKTHLVKKPKETASDAESDNATFPPPNQLALVIPSVDSTTSEELLETPQKPEDLHAIPSLKQFQLYHHVGYSLLICVRCPRAILGTHKDVWAHLRSHKHPQSSIPQDLSDILKALKLRTKPERPTRMIDPIQCIPYIEGVYCTVDGCCYAALTAGTWDRTHRKIHGTESMGACYVQQVFFERYWAVKPNYTLFPAPDGGTKLFLQKILDSVTNRPSTVAKEGVAEYDVRKNVPYYLKALGWLQTMQGLSYKAVECLVEMPNPAETYLWRLDEVTTIYLKSLEGVIRNLQSVVLRLINTGKHGPINNKPFSMTQEEATLSHYCHYGVQMLAMALRYVEDPKKYGLKVLYSPAQKTGINLLRSKLANNAEDSDLIISIEIVLRLLFFDEDREISLARAKEGPMYCFLLGLAINGKQGQFLECQYITSKLSAVQFLMRLVSSKYIIDEANEKRITPFEFQATWIPKWLMEDHPCPFEEVRKVMHITSHEAYSTRRLPNFQWSEGGQSFYIDGQKVRLCDLRNMYTEELEEVRKLILELALDVPTAFDKNKIVDRLTETRVGYNMFSQHAAYFDDLGGRILSSMVMKHTRTFIHKIDDEGNVDWNIIALQNWADKARILNGKLFFLNHIGNGQPGRGTEECAMLLRNTENAIRNLFSTSRGIASIIAYSKTTQTTSHEKWIARFPHITVSDPMLAMLVFIRPTQEYIDSILHPGENEVRLHTHLWMNGRSPWTSEALSAYIRKKCKQYISKDVEIGVALWRQAFSGISQAIGLRLEEDIEEEEMSSVLDAQQGHSTRVAQRLYAMQLEQLGGLNDTVLMKYWTASRLIHRTLFLLADPADEDEPSGEPSAQDPASLSLKEVRKSIRDLQMEVAKLVPTLQTMLHEESNHAWRRNMPQILERIDDRYFVVKNTSLPPSSAPSSVAYVLPSAVDSTALAALRAMMQDEQAEFRSLEQYHAFHTIMKRDRHVLSIAATGSGKTLPIQLAGSRMEEGKLIILVLPFAILYSQAKQTFNLRGVEYQDWSKDPRLPGREVQVVGVSLEAFGSDRFKAVLRTLAVEDRLWCLVADEASCYVEDAEWRAAFTEATDSFQEERNIPIHLLTATCPPGKETALFSAFGIKLDHQHVTLTLRSSTTRRDIVIRDIQQRMEEDISDWKKRILSTILESAAGLTGNQRILVFCTKILSAQEWATMLSCECITGGLSNEDRTAVYKRWTSGTKKILVGNKALYFGLDYSGVAYTFHVELPSAMSEFVQAMGRGGRDHRITHSTSVLCLPKTFPTVYTPTPAESYGGKQEFRDMLVSTQCILFHLSTFMDGSELAFSCSREYPQCFRCPTRPKSTLVDRTPKSLSKHRESAQPYLRSSQPASWLSSSSLSSNRNHELQNSTKYHEMKLLEGVHRRLLELGGNCLVCRIEGLTVSHNVEHCSIIKSLVPQQFNAGRNVYIEWKMSVMRRTGLTGLHTECLCPFDSIAEDLFWHTGDPGTKKVCLYKHAIQAACALVLLSSNAGRLFMESCPQYTQETNLVTWVEALAQKKTNVLHGCSNGLLYVFPYLYDQIK